MSIFKRTLSLALVFAMLLAVAPVMPVSAEETPSSNNAVSVDVAAAGGNMNLTEVGTTDWIHFTSEQVNRKASAAYLEAYNAWLADYAAWEDSFAGKAEIIDYMSTSGNSGRTFGQTSDQVWRFQTFCPTVSGKLTTVQVAVIKKGTPSALVAKLYKVTDTSNYTVEMLGSQTIAADDITSNVALTLNFGDIEVEAGTYYAVALTQETLDQDNLYHWCNSSNSMPNGKIKNAEGTEWVQESTAAALYVQVGEVGEAPAAPETSTADIISFETTGDAKMASTMGDSVVAYSWSDGAPTMSMSGSTKGGVISYLNGTLNETVPEGNGWKITVPADNSIQTLTFVSGVWQSSGKITIYADGEAVYTNAELTAGGSSVVKTYTVTVSPNVDIEVVYEITAETSDWGNSSLGGVALTREALPEETPAVSVDVAEAGGSMNLTEVGSTDWIHFTSSQVNRKISAESQEAYDAWRAEYAAWEESFAGKAQIIDYMSTEGTSGRTFGQTSDQVWRFQAFQPTVSGDLKKVEVAVIKKGTPSALIAKLFKVTDTSSMTVEELASVTIAAEDITSNTRLALNFGDIKVEAGSTYAVAMTQQTLDQDNLYHWCNSSNPVFNGKIKDAEGTEWVKESTAAALYVQIGEVTEAPVVPEASAADIIKFESIGEAKMASSMSDSVVAYSWSDGTPTESKSGYTYGGVISYLNGTLNETVPEGNGWKISVPADDSIQTLTFVSGVWQSSGKISIYAGGEVVYTNAELVSTGAATVKTYTVTVSPNVDIEVVYEITAETNDWGNSSLGGVTLSRTEADESVDYVQLLQETLEQAQTWVNYPGVSEYFKNQLTTAIARAEAALAKGEELTAGEAYTAYIMLRNSIQAVKNSYSSGNFANSYASGMTASFGWEGDKDAPIQWIDGTYKLRDNGNQLVTFGVGSLDADSVSWYNAEGYLPCFVSEYEKDGLSVKVENFADEVYVNGNRYEIAYSRMTVTNVGTQKLMLPVVSENLTALNDAAINDAGFIEVGETIVREYCIGADRFGGTYAYPTSEELAAQGSFDEHYEHMKNYWNTRLENIVDIEEIPEAYETLINAYKAGYIYMLIIADGYELHVGENGYDRVFDHDVIGMLASLILSGHTENFTEYAQYILLNVQYPDARWKYSWPFALYLQKTGDYDTILKYWSDLKSNTHNIADCREVCKISGYENVTTESGAIARIMKRTDAIDSYGYWTIDNWASLFGLTTYAYICDQMYTKYGDEQYKTEYDWAKAEYDSLLESVEAVLKKTMTDYDFDYIPISMVVPNELSARKDVRDGNWAAHYLFGRWDWDGYLFGADQDSFLHQYVDQTYDYIIENKSTVFDSIYNMGGYPHGYYSSAYNAGYFSGALSGEAYRDGGIEAYLWMIENAQGGPFSWWEGVAYPSSKNVWNIDCSNGGGGSCQHMWGQSTATKVLIDSFLAEKDDGTIIAGRGLPVEFNADGETITISNYLCNGGKRIGFTMTTKGTTVTFELTGDKLENAVSLELLALVNNIASVSDESCTIDQEAGTVLIPAGVTKVTIEMKTGLADIIERDDAVAEANKALSKANAVEKDQYVTLTVKALEDAVDALKAAIEKGTASEIYAAIPAVEDAIDGLVVNKVYDIFYDTITGNEKKSGYSFGEEVDERVRYVTFKTGDTDITFNQLVFDLGSDGDLTADALISIYSLEEDHYTLADCLTTIRVKPSEMKAGMEMLDVENPITLKAGTYYALHFAADHSEGNYCSWTFGTTNDVDMDGLYHVKIQGNGNVVDESFLGQAMVQMRTLAIDKTGLDAAVEALTEEELTSAEAQAAIEVLLDENATQEEIDAALLALTSAAVVKEVEALIDEIGEVTLDSSAAIKAARAAYEGLTVEEKLMVSNYAELVKAESVYAALVAETAKNEAEEARKAAEEAQKAAEEAQKAAEEAAKNAAQDREAAEEAAIKAAEALKAAQEAQKAAEQAQEAAELAKKAAEESNLSAAESAASAAASAAEVAALYEEIAAMKAEMSNMLAESLKAAALAQKAALESAKYYALFELAQAINAVDTTDFDTEQLAALDAAADLAREQIENAETAAEAEKAVDVFETSVDSIKDLCKARLFKDVNLDAWYHEGLDYVLNHGYMVGVSDTAFMPEGEATRAQIITILYRIAGSPDVSGLTNQFTDVEKNVWYTDAICWAVSEGIVTGVTDTTFEPMASVTREQLAVMLYRYSNAAKVEKDFVSDFADASNISEYAREALNWAVASGLINGVGSNKLDPTGTAVRAQIATIIMRYCDM